jgi:hypothetical protein
MWMQLCGVEEMQETTVMLTDEEKDVLIRWLEEKSLTTSVHMRHICKTIIKKLKEE